MRTRRNSGTEPFTRTHAEWVAMGNRPERARVYAAHPFLGVPVLLATGRLTPAEVQLFGDIANDAATSPHLTSDNAARWLAERN